MYEAQKVKRICQYRDTFLFRKRIMFHFKIGVFYYIAYKKIILGSTLNCYWYCMYPDP